jgi:hypothetical protein
MKVMCHAYVAGSAEGCGAVGLCVVLSPPLEGLHAQRLICNSL